MAKEIATFGAGCFWTPELKFSKLKGVKKTEVGYMGGDETHANVSYEDVCTDETGHAEVVRVEFDNKIITYEELLKAFFGIHDPTQMNRQGPDFGSQYRTIIFYHNDKQKKSASKLMKESQKKYDKKIVTQIVSAGKFYRAEEYHQKYLEKRGEEFCHV